MHIVSRFGTENGKPMDLVEDLLFSMLNMVF